MPGNWDEVIRIYGENFELVHSVQINQLGDTALHFAISYGQDRLVEKLVKIIFDKNKEVLKRKKKKKGIPLCIWLHQWELWKCASELLKLIHHWG